MRRKCRAVLKKWVLATAVFAVHRSECSNEKLSESTKIDDLDTQLPAAAVWQQSGQTEHFPNYIRAQLLDRTLMKKSDWMNPLSAPFKAHQSDVSLYLSHFSKLLTVLSFPLAPGWTHDVSRRLVECCFEFSSTWVGRGDKLLSLLFVLVAGWNVFQFQHECRFGSSDTAAPGLHHSGNHQDTITIFSRRCFKNNLFASKEFRWEL